MTAPFCSPMTLSSVSNPPTKSPDDAAVSVNFLDCQEFFPQKKTQQKQREGTWASLDRATNRHTLTYLGTKPQDQWK